MTGTTDTEKNIREMKARTYACLSAGLAGSLIPPAIILLAGFLRDVEEYYTYGNYTSGTAVHIATDDNGGTLHMVDLRGTACCGLLFLAAVCLLAVLVRFYLKKMKDAGKKSVPVVISVLTALFSAGVFGTLLLQTAEMLILWYTHL